ncbi:hypothetical protein Taro_038490 [Colocasia esculenta]|uniref:Uncharacterized protein n=1 Tax=Colocasia esculenta TaxID=4460 RepID=A0A843WE12_COLES|nr:hypothetical protein [Colocasia esculenta]
MRFLRNSPETEKSTSDRALEGVVASAHVYIVALVRGVVASAHANMNLFLDEVSTLHEPSK